MATAELRDGSRGRGCMTGAHRHQVLAGTTCSWPSLAPARRAIWSWRLPLLVAPPGHAARARGRGGSALGSGRLLRRGKNETWITPGRKYRAWYRRIPVMLAHAFLASPPAAPARHRAPPASGARKPPLKGDLMPVESLDEPSRRYARRRSGRRERARPDPAHRRREPRLFNLHVHVTMPRAFHSNGQIGTLPPRGNDTRKEIKGCCILGAGLRCACVADEVAKLVAAGDAELGVGAVQV